MASVTLDRMWINRLDTGEAIAAYTLEDRPQEYSIDLEVRTYASGRQRAESVAGERGTVSFTLALVSLATIVELRSWAGIAVQARDHRGQKWLGVFASVTPVELKDPALYHAAITIRTLTVVEGV